MEMLVNIQEAAKMLGVSIQTIRNWGDTGYLNPIRTSGGHRRYLLDEIKSKLNPKIATWEGEHLERLIVTSIKKGGSHPNAKVCGGFTKEQIGMLLYNQDIIDDDNKDENLFKMAEYLSTPYLFKTQVTTYPTSYVLNKRVRSNPANKCHHVVLESENVVCSTHKFNKEFNETDEQVFKFIAKKIDEECISDVISNAESINSSKKSLNKTIDQAINLINENTATDGPKFVIYPPELFSGNANLIKYNDNLRYLPSDDSGYKTYISRLVPENTVLVGSKNEDFVGYVFCPYILITFDRTRDRFISMVGKKLLHEGAKHYITINCS